MILRRLWMLAFAVAGVWLSVRTVEFLARQAAHGAPFDLWSYEGLLLAVPIGMIGAIVGAIVGGLLLPLRAQ